MKAGCAIGAIFSSIAPVAYAHRRATIIVALTVIAARIVGSGVALIAVVTGVPLVAIAAGYDTVVVVALAVVVTRRAIRGALFIAYAKPVFLVGSGRTFLFIWHTIAVFFVGTIRTFTWAAFAGYGNSMYQ